MTDPRDQIEVFASPEGHVSIDVGGYLWLALPTEKVGGLVIRKDMTIAELVDRLGPPDITPQDPVGIIWN